MKLALGSVPFLAFGGLIVAGIVKAAQPDGSAWLLIGSLLVFIGAMSMCCFPPKH